MRKHLLLVAVTVLLPGCAGFDPFRAAGPALVRPAQPTQMGELPPRPLAGNSERLLFEANRLAEEVKQGRMTRTQAADSLGRSRIAWVGRNLIDDEVFRAYRQIALERDTDKISQSEAQTRIYDVLKRWQRRWLYLQPRPADPAFTNFLMKVYSLPQLQ